MLEKKKRARASQFKNIFLWSDGRMCVYAFRFKTATNLPCNGILHPLNGSSFFLLISRQKTHADISVRYYLRSNRNPYADRTFHNFRDERCPSDSFSILPIEQANVQLLSPLCLSADNKVISNVFNRQISVTVEIGNRRVHSYYRSR